MPRCRIVFAPLAMASLGGLTWAAPAGAQEEAPPPPPAAEAPPAPRVSPGHYYLGADVLWGTISSGFHAIDGSKGAGLQVVVGLRFTESLSWDTRGGGFWNASVGPTPEINYPADRAEYAFLLTGLVWELQGGGAPVSAWLGAWGGYHSVQWDTYWYSVSGFGFSLGAGAQLRLPLGLVRLGAELSLVHATSTYDAPAGGTTCFAVTGGWLLDFGR